MRRAGFDYIGRTADICRRVAIRAAAEPQRLPRRAARRRASERCARSAFAPCGARHTVARRFPHFVRPWVRRRATSSSLSVRLSHPRPRFPPRPPSPSRSPRTPALRFARATHASTHSPLGNSGIHHPVGSRPCQWSTRQTTSARGHAPDPATVGGFGKALPRARAKHQPAGEVPPPPRRDNHDGAWSLAEWVVPVLGLDEVKEARAVGHPEPRGCEARRGAFAGARRRRRGRVPRFLQPGRA